MQAKPLTITISGGRGRDQMKTALSLAVEEITHQNPHLRFEKVIATNNGEYATELFAKFRPIKEAKND